MGWLDEVLAILSEPGGVTLLRSLIAAAADDEEVGRRLRGILGGGSSLETRLQAGIDSSELRADAPLTEIVEALMGAVVIHALGREPHDPDTAERLVGIVLEGNRPTG